MAKDEILGELAKLGENYEIEMRLQTIERKLNLLLKHFGIKDNKEILKGAEI